MGQRPTTHARQANAKSMEDGELVRRALTGDGDAFRTIMGKYNQRLYRMARSIVGSDWEAEEVVQEAWVRAFTHLQSFRGDSSLPTWLTRIAINESLGRLRARRPTVEFESAEARQAQIIPFPNGAAPNDPERTMAQREILRLVEQATDALPETYRSVFVARVIEGLSVEDTAEVLALRAETVKTRLHRARTLVREHLDKQIGPVLLDAFPFAGQRCARLTDAVLRRLGLPC